MKTHPAVYWRQQQDEKKLLGQVGKIITLTKIAENEFWVGIIKVGKQKISGEIIAYQKEPKIGDQVIGILRIKEKEGRAGLIKYGVKFKLIENSRRE